MWISQPSFTTDYSIMLFHILITYINPFLFQREVSRCAWPSVWFQERPNYTGVLQWCLRARWDGESNHAAQHTHQVKQSLPVPCSHDTPDDFIMLIFYSYYIRWMWFLLTPFSMHDYLLTIFSQVRCGMGRYLIWMASMKSKGRFSYAGKRECSLTFINSTMQLLISYFP